MKIFEFTDKDVTGSHYNPAADKHTKRNLGDSRKEVLSLRKLNRLKKMRALRQLEDLKRQDLLAIMYGQPDDDQGGGAGPMGF
jgi:hypothetical protein